MITIYNLQAVSATAETKLFLRDGYHKYDVEIRAEIEASRAYETGPAIVMKWLITHSTIATAIPEIARGAVIGEQDWMVELPVRSPPSHTDELKKEYPEIVELRDKLLRKEQFDRRDEWNLKELCEATGWDKDDVKEELANIDKDPVEREKVYADLFSKYYEEARKLNEEGDNVQAAEKLWGAITALVKVYSCKKGVFVAHWGRGKLHKFVEENVEEAFREKFSDLLTFGGELHEHFFERHLPRRKFDRRWNQCIRLIDELKERVN